MQECIFGQGSAPDPLVELTAHSQALQMDFVAGKGHKKGRSKEQREGRETNHLHAEKMRSRRPCC